VASDRGHRIVVADTGHDRVVVLELAPDTETEAGPAVPARISHVVTSLRAPTGVRLYGSDLLICDTGNDRVVRIDLDTRPAPDEDVEPDPAGIIRLRARPVDALAVDLASPLDVVADLDRSLVVASAGHHELWRVPQYGASPGVIAGSGLQGLHDGRADVADLAQPSGLARVPAGVAFVDADSSSLRLLTNTGRVRTLVGEGLFDWGSRDGRGLRGRFQRPEGVAATPDGGTLYIADTYNHLVRDWHRRDLGTLPIGGLDEPRGLDVLPDGRLVIADTGNHRIVVADPATGAVVPVVVAMTTLPAAVPIVEPGTVLVVDAGAPFVVPFRVDLGPYELEAGTERPVRAVVETDPPSLLGDGPRRWRHVAPAGELGLCAGDAGSGWLVLTVTAAVRRDGACSARTSVTRHHLTVRG
jgi:DNA-binding beta-propeller fold protein YncE